uniref:Uncharacterized protein n=1 Tax=Strombidium rassoulzadegani TaxID=1082188 RepID=A0A7S3CV56_9SPIT
MPSHRLLHPRQLLLELHQEHLLLEQLVVGLVARALQLLYLGFVSGLQVPQQSGLAKALEGFEGGPHVGFTVRALSVGPQIVDFALEVLENALVVLDGVDQHVARLELLVLGP